MGINLRPYWKQTINLIKKNYHIVIYTASHQAYADAKYIDLGTSNMPHSSDLHESLIYQKEGFGARAVCYDTYEYDL